MIYVVSIVVVVVAQFCETKPIDKRWLESTSLRRWTAYHHKRRFKHWIATPYEVWDTSSAPSHAHEPKQFEPIMPNGSQTRWNARLMMKSTNLRHGPQWADTRDGDGDGLTRESESDTEYCAIFRVASKYKWRNSTLKVGRVLWVCELEVL